MLYNGVANKRRPNTETPNNTNNFLFIKNILTEQLRTRTFTRNYQANNYANAKCEYGVRLIGLLYCIKKHHIFRSCVLTPLIKSQSVIEISPIAASKSVGDFTNEL